jgi:tRNA threonylcarbamoyladenosine biosynthesis protein TsaE
MPSTEHGSSDRPPVADFVIDCVDEDAVGDFARRLAAMLPRRSTLALEGDLGAGKTTFVKMLATTLSLDPRDVTSPTFTLVHEHPVSQAALADRPAWLVHVDAYRLAGLGDLATIGWEELLSRDGWLAVEWASRIAAALPDDTITIAIDVTGPDSRRIRLTDPTAAVVAKLRS